LILVLISCAVYDPPKKFNKKPTQTVIRKRNNQPTLVRA